MRVVLDTNILVSALIRKGSLPSRILDLWFDDGFVLLTHALQFDELRAVTRRPQVRRLIRSSEAGRLVNQLHASAEVLGLISITQRCDDPGDDFLLAICERGRAHFLVTGDKAGLLKLVSHGRTAIVTARGFLAALGGSL